MPKRIQIKVSAPTTTLDEKEFYALTDLLYEALKGNQAGCAAALGINVKTWRKWEQTPPEWPWWNLVLRHIIIEVLSQLQSRGGVTRHHRNRILESLSRIKRSDTLIQEAERLSFEYTGSEAHLRKLLSRKGMYWDQIKLPANNGGYTEKTLRVAAKKLGIIKKQKGFGDTKRSYWRLPNEEDE